MFRLLEFLKIHHITMPKQVIVQPSIEAVEIIDTPIPAPQENEVVVKVVVSGTNPKDWKYPHWCVFPFSFLVFGRPFHKHLSRGGDS